MRASIVLVGIFSLLGVSAWVVVRWPAAWWGMAMLVLGLVPVGLGVASWMRVEPLVVVFDRAVLRRPTREWRRVMALTRQLAEVDAQLVALGLAPLGACVALELAPGIARHDPADARASLERLLAARALTLSPELRCALEQLGELLRVAAEQRARFCLLPVAGWSGLIEPNLGLHFGG